MDEDVGVVIGLLGHFGDRVDEADRLGEVGALEVAHDRRRLAPPAGQSLSGAPRSAGFERRSIKYSVRIVSLVPHATELCFALGLGDELIAVTHECDYPPAALALPRVDARHARRRPRRGCRSMPPCASAPAPANRSTSSTATSLRALEPELIVTQALCPVCAVSYEEVAELAAELPRSPHVIALDPHTLGETLGDVRTIAEATGRRDDGVALIARIAGRIDRVRLAVRGASRPRVAALEWLDPVFVAGHWTPQLIELAGGDDVLGLPGRAAPSSSTGRPSRPPSPRS